MFTNWNKKVEDKFFLSIGDADADAGVDSGAGAGGAPPEGGVADGGAEPDGGSAPPAPPEKRTLREELAENFRAASEADADADKARQEKEKRDGKGRFAKKDGEAPPAEAAAGEPPAAGAEAPPADADADKDKAAKEAKEALAVPAGLSKEAAAEWAKVPPVVQAAINKRLADSQKGVDELKGRYADIDGALSPHMEAIRKHGHTPAQATAQLFGWFQALAANPKVAFPALVQSFGLKAEDVFGIQPAAPAAAGAAAPAGGAAAPTPSEMDDIPASVKKYIDDQNAKLAGMEKKFTEKFGSLEDNFATQNQEKTNQVLANWAKDKPHFEELRTMMAQMINSGAIPLLADGRVDLDGAYEAAKWANPAVREKVLAETKVAEAAAAKKKEEDRKKLLQDQADKARRSNVSVSTTAPGAAVPGATAPKGKGATVRQSLDAAIAAARENA